MEWVPVYSHLRFWTIYDFTHSTSLWNLKKKTINTYTTVTSFGGYLPQNVHTFTFTTFTCIVFEFVFFLFQWEAHSQKSLISRSHAQYELLCGVSFSGPVEHVQLLAPFVVIRNKEVNITAVVLPSHSRTVTYFWWLGNNTEVTRLMNMHFSLSFYYNVSS